MLRPILYITNKRKINMNFLLKVNTFRPQEVGIKNLIDKLKFGLNNTKPIFSDRFDNLIKVLFNLLFEVKFL